MNIIKVDLGELVVSKSPDVLTTLGLGSCVGLALYDPMTKIGGLAHIMLPDIGCVKNRENKTRFANTAIKIMINEMVDKGASKKRMVAKMAGGAHMFNFIKAGDSLGLTIGERNVEVIRKELADERITLIGEDVGLDYGRSIDFYLETGVFKIRALQHPDKGI